MIENAKGCTVTETPLLGSLNRIDDALNSAIARYNSNIIRLGSKVEELDKLDSPMQEGNPEEDVVVISLIERLWEKVELLQNLNGILDNKIERLNAAI